MSKPPQDPVMLLKFGCGRPAGRPAVRNFFWYPFLINLLREFDQKVPHFEFSAFSSTVHGDFAKKWVIEKHMV